MEDQTRIQPTLGHYMGGCQVLVSLPGSAVPSLKYRVVFRSVFDPAISSTVSAHEVKNGVLQCTSPEHGRPDVTSVTVRTDSPQHEYIAATQFQFQDRISLQLCSPPPLTRQDFKFLLISMVSLPIDEVLRNSAPLDNLLVSAILQQPPLISSIDVKSLFEGCRLAYNNDKANLFHFSGEFGLPRFADILTNQSSAVKYSLKAELFRRTTAGSTPLATAKKNTADCGREVKAVLADAIAEFNESKHDKGRSAKKEKMRVRTQSCPNRLPKSLALQDVTLETLESEDGASAAVQKPKPKRKFWSKKTSKSQLRNGAGGAAQASSRQAMGTEGLMYCVAVVAMSSGSDSDYGVKRIDKTTVQYFWNNALAFVQATSDFVPPPKSGKTKMLPLKIGDIAVVVKRGEGLKSGEVYGLVNNTDVGVFPLCHVKRISMDDARVVLKYHCARKTSSLPQLEKISTDQLAVPCSKDEAAATSEYEVMEKPSCRTAVQEETVHWYQVTNQAEITKDFTPASNLPDYVDYLTLQAGEVVNVVCMPATEDWALLEHRGRVGRALHTVFRALPESATNVKVKPTYMDAKLGTKPIQPGDVIAVGITYANELKISAVVYGDAGANFQQVQALAASRAATGGPEVVYDSPETGERLRTAALLDEGTDRESCVSTQGDVGTGFDCGSDTSVQSLSGSASDRTKASDITTPENVHTGVATRTTQSAQQCSRQRSSSAQSAEGSSSQTSHRSGSRAATPGAGTHRDTAHQLQLGSPSGGSPPSVHILAKRSPDVFPKPLYRAQSVDTALDSDADLKKGTGEQRLGGVMSSTTPNSLQAGDDKGTDFKAQMLAGCATLSQSERCLAEQEKTALPSSRKANLRMSLRRSPNADQVTSSIKPRPASVSGVKPGSRNDPPPLSPRPTPKRNGNRAATLPAGVLPSAASSRSSPSAGFSAAQQTVAGSAGMLPPGSHGPVVTGSHAQLTGLKYPMMKVDLPGTGSLRKR